MSEEVENTEVKTFTQEDVDRIVTERVSRERAKYEDYGDLKAKAEAVDSLNKQIEELTGKLSESDKRASDAELSNLRLRVSAEHKVPLKALTATDEEGLIEQANALTEWKGEGAGLTREGQNSGNSSGKTVDAKERARQALANFS